MIRKLAGPAPTLLTAAGLGWLAAAAWMYAVVLGVAAVGVALLLLGWLLDKEN